MTVTDQQYQDLLFEMEELQQRVGGVATRLVTAESIASKHGRRHTDRGRDPVLASGVKGHSHSPSAFFLGGI